jgi:teichoic acid transport system ATP-binding protein
MDFQQKCYDSFESFKKNGRTILFVSHDLNVIEKFCDRAILLEKGEIKAQGEPDVVIAQYQENMELTKMVHT